MTNKYFLLCLRSAIAKRLQKSIAYSCVAGIALFPALSANAAQVELSVYKSSNTPAANCPQKVIVTEQNAPYYEGGYTINGSAKLSSFAESFTISNTDPFSVTWVANLKPAFSKCIAAGSIVKSGTEDKNSDFHLRVRFTGGKVFLILDMTGLKDANNFFPVITKKGVTAGNPTWSWGGTD
uniref:hypothetical protein n=1 Tax=Hassallia byssoidea TaxID=482630 RepID=UPI0006937D89|nr:hypothetical protein [Hassalia byssoidea]